MSDFGLIIWDKSVVDWDKQVCEKLDCKLKQFFSEHPEFGESNIDLPYSIEELAATRRVILRARDLYARAMWRQKQGLEFDATAISEIERISSGHSHRGDTVRIINWDGTPRDRSKDPLSFVTDSDLDGVGPSTQ